MNKFKRIFFIFIAPLAIFPLLYLIKSYVFWELVDIPNDFYYRYWSFGLYSAFVLGPLIAGYLGPNE